MSHTSGSFAAYRPDDRYKQIIDSIEDYAIYMLDCFGNIVTWNLGAERSKGYTSEEVIGRHFKLFFLPEDVAAGVPAERLRQAEFEGRSIGEGWRLRKNGERYWASYVITAMRDPAGRLTGFAKVTRDFTERKRNEDAMAAVQAALQDERDRMQAFTESSMDAFFICRAVRDAEGCIEDFIFTYLNPSVENLISIPLDILLGGRMCEFMPVHRASGLFDMYCRVVDTGDPLAVEFAVADQDIKASWLRVQAVKLLDGIAITASDITLRKQQEGHISHLAHHDALTGLPNRVLMTDRISQAIERAKRYANRVAVIVLDLDDFKQVNDSFGHAAGDTALVCVAARLKAAVRASDTVIRIGGDEFVILMPDLSASAGAQLGARKILDSFDLPIDLFPDAYDVRSTHMGASIGIALYPDDATTPEGLLQVADSAMYQAKRRGKQQFATVAPGSAHLLRDQKLLGLSGNEETSFPRTVHKE